jgi:putative endonuclease
VSAFVYLARCRDGSLYCGWTTDPEAREAAHNSGRGAAYTRARRPVRLVYLERVRDRIAALKREWAIKQLPRGEKLRLVARGARGRTRSA